MSSTPLPLNAIASLATPYRDQKDNLLHMSFKRTIGEPNPPQIEDSPDVLEDVPTRPPSSLPPPGALAVHLGMDERIHSSETSMLCSVSVTRIQGSEEGAAVPVLPSLVAKFSQPGSHGHLLPEFYYYEEA
ncbi:hypothetical protein EIP86_002824 [Pleurotus ostreatoroseus]|nr:hypothetical protein EIP86_002824 [Pleurotus ostreatoroseus]